MRMAIRVGTALAFIASLQSDIYAETWYVAASGDDAAAGTNWVTAKQTIQAAINSSYPQSDTILVSNGVYASGGSSLYGQGTNRIQLLTGIRVQSVNGPAVTIIQGAGSNLATGIRCAYVANYATLVGFTLTNGFAVDGGGVWCETYGVVSNCIITGNKASGGGGRHSGDSSTVVSSAIRPTAAADRTRAR